MKFSGGEFQSVGIIFLILTVIVHVEFARAVSRDVAELERNGEKIELVGSSIWILATLLGGVIAAGVYWIVHHDITRSR